MSAESSARLTEGDVNLSPRRQSWRQRLSGQSRELLERDERVFLHQSLSTPCLDALAACQGSEIITVDGRRMLDFHGNSVHQIGHANPAVVQAVKEQLDSLAFCPRRFTNEPAVRLAEKLTELAPMDGGKVLFAPGGTSAVGMALKIARLATGRHKTVSMWDSFHGASLDAVSLGGEALFRAGMGPLLPGTEHVPPAEPSNCLWNDAGDCIGCGLKCARYVDYVLEKEGDVAAVIAEPVRCTTVHVPPPGYWRAVREACGRHGALLVFDETAVCLGRTGRMFACEHFGAVPDMLIAGKGLGGGVAPLAAVIARADLDVGGRVALGHYTHEKNPVASAAGLAAIAVIEEQALLQRAVKLGSLAVDALWDLTEEYPAVHEARGLGLALALELKSAEAAEAVLYGCLERGLSFKVSAGNVLTLTPPLTLSNEELQRALDILRFSLRSI